MLENHTIHFALENFEGPLDFLLHLVQKKEIDIYEVSIHKITDQFLKKLQEYAASFDLSAEFIGTLATLLLIKSRTLLPKHEVLEEEDDPQFEMIHQLIDYCRFKEAAKRLKLIEGEASLHFSRGIEVGGECVVKKPLGLQSITLQDLAEHFQNCLKKTTFKVKSIHEEIFTVAEKKEWLQGLLKEGEELNFLSLFKSEQCKEEWIVTFLAILELMKLGLIAVFKQEGDLIVRKV